MDNHTLKLSKLIEVTYGLEGPDGGATQLEELASQRRRPPREGWPA